MYESDTFHLLNNPKSVGSLSLLPTHTYTHTYSRCSQKLIYFIVFWFLSIGHTTG